VFGLLIPVLKLPPINQTAAEVVPPRLARIMVEEKPKPPPPKPLELPKPTPAAVPQPKPPVDRTAQARKEAEKSGLLKLQDQLADLRQQMDKPPDQTKNLTGAVGADTKAERSLITSKAGAGSAGIVTTSAASRGFGSGAGALTGHETTSVNSRVAAIGTPGTATRTGTGTSGKAARSNEEVELEIDRNKGAIYALYARALREHADLQGKLVLEFTISPAGEVTACRVVSSELKDAELERRIVARFRLIRFAAKDVLTMTTSKPIEFFPGG
jgi:protein TonB